MSASTRSEARIENFNKLHLHREKCSRKCRGDLLQRSVLRCALWWSVLGGVRAGGGGERDRVEKGVILAYDLFFPFCILLEEIKSLSTLVQKSQLRAPFGSDAYPQDVFFGLDVLGVVASSKPSPESSDQFMLFPYPCESCKFIRHLAVHCFRP